MRRWFWMVIVMLVNNVAVGQSVVGILHDPSVPKRSGHADAKRLAQLLQRSGLTVRLLSSDELANPQTLTPQNVTVVVLPYGAFFPADAVDNFRRYLKAGGRFLSLGGYAFDEVYERDKGQRRRDKFEWEKVAHEKVQADITPERIRITVPNDAPVNWHRVRAFVELRPEATYLLTGKVRTDGITDGHGAYLAVDYYDTNGNRISFQQTQIVKHTKDWQELGIVLHVPKGTAKEAINCLVHGHGTAEFAEVKLQPHPSVNTRWGDARDAMHTTPDQIGVFDPSFRIDGATELHRGDIGQGKWGKGNDTLLWRSEEPLKGYAAVGLIGSNNPVFPQAWAKITPVLIARDKYGRYLGLAFSVMHHFAGPYAGSAWAFCGIESHDLTKVPAFQTVLVQVVRHILQGVYLHSLQPSLFTFRKGETATISVKIRNDGIASQTVTVRLEVYPMPDSLRMGKAIVLGEQTVTLSPREQTTVQMQWRITKDTMPLYAIRAVLRRSNSEIRNPKSEINDELWSGFCVWDEQVLKSAKPIAWQNNTLCEWDAKTQTWRPRFWLGTNQTGVMFAPEATWENPLQWEWEFALMRQMGLKVLRVLHISHFAGDFEKPHEAFWRRYDALVLMAHRHGLILMPCLHDWTGGVSISDEALRKQCALVRQIGARYKDAPRIVWDIENEAPVEIRDIPDLRHLFNEWLRQRYGTTERLQEAWNEQVKLGEVPFTPHNPRGWDDLKFRDIQHFRRWLIERWVKANVQALREGGAKQPVTDEIDWKVCGDHYEGSKWLDFTNLHYYGDRSPAAIATNLKFHERLARGHGLAVGEFGARDHPSFRFGGWGYAPTEEVIRHFVRLPLLTFALGGSMALNWDFKDMEACIFPWGLVHQHGLWQRIADGEWQVEAALKASGKAFAAVAKLLAQCEPVADAITNVIVVLPDEHLLGAEGEVHVSGMGPAGRISQGVFRSLEALLRLRVPFRVAREWEWTERMHASEIGHWSLDIAVLPIPFVWRDETFVAVKKFVEQGGIAIITGDFTFDLNRKRTQAKRLRELLGIDFMSGVASPMDTTSSVRCVATDKSFPLTEWQGKPCVTMGQGARDMGQVLAATEKGEPVVLTNRIGKGWVIFSADAPELRSKDETMKLYQASLQSAEWFSNVKVFPQPPTQRATLTVLVLALADHLLTDDDLPIALPLSADGTNFVVLQAGVWQLAWKKRQATITVRDLVTGKILHRFTTQPKKGMLTLTILPDLMLTEWRVE